MAKNNEIKVILFVSILLLIVGILCKGLFLPLDKTTNAWIASIQAAWLVGFFKFIGMMFDTLGMFIYSAIIVVLLWKAKKKKDSAHFAIAMAVGGLLSFAIKAIVARQRPINAIVSTADFSFPSGHTLSAVIFFGLIIYLASKYGREQAFKRKIYAACIIMPVIIGFSRLYLNVHWLSEVLGGFVLGMIILALSIIARNAADRKKH